MHYNMYYIMYKMHSYPYMSQSVFKLYSNMSLIVFFFFIQIQLFLIKQVFKKQFFNIPVFFA